MRTLALLLLILVPTVVHADEWTSTDTAMQITYTVLHVIDWGQTLDVSKHPIRAGGVPASETNPVLGKHPSVGAVNTYMASTLAGHAVASYLLPGKWRTAWQVAGIGIEAYVVGRNYSLGFHATF